MRRRATAQAPARLARRAIMVASLVASMLVPSSVAGGGPLPACRFDDIPTVPSDYASGPITLVDHLLTIGRKYVPPDLIPVGEMGLAGGGLIREIAARDTRAMARAAAANGTPIGAWSAYRSYRSQRQLYEDGVAAYGVKVASRYWARPGHSEHQLGLGVDFMTAGGGSPLVGDWSTTPAGAWMMDNAWKYGWVLSFPKGKRSITCFSYEPWHYRYVGREVASEIHESGLTTREYLWANVTKVDLGDDEPGASAGPTEPPPGTAAPSTPAETPGPPAAASPGATPPGSGGVASSGSLPVLAGFVLALGAVVLLALGLRRPGRRVR
jgi:D-alanyl-D-alanine carboxypeptidase